MSEHFSISEEDFKLETAQGYDGGPIGSGEIHGEAGRSESYDAGTDRATLDRMWNQAVMDANYAEANRIHDLLHPLS